MAHSSVAYVEPNYTNNSLTEAAGDGRRYDRAPDLEDYCIAMDIEVMLSTREKSAQVSEENRCIIMSYRSGEGGTENIRFMSGTKIGGYARNNDGTYSPKLNRNNPNVLSSYYADMYITDIIDYGTTEMLGIKSIDVEYNSTCVPVITVKFTDVRGMSLFHPSEFNHSMSYNGINGFSKDNIAQSFFQAFFTLPLPIFTIHMKGFYGKPVSYQVMCDKFDSAFDSKNGYFDVTVRFVGFAYSFMADVSLNALLAAPYSDYIGAQYWEDKVNNGDFKLIGKYGEPQRMPKLYDIRKKFELLVVESNEELKPSVDEEESQKHEMEIEKLSNISRKFRNWYTKLFNTVTEKYGNDFCYIMGGVNDTPYKRVIILTNGKNIQGDSLVDEFKQYGDFIKVTEDLYNEIETYNSSATAHRKLDNIKKDSEGNFFDYKKRKIFSGITYNSKTNGYGFLGLLKDCGIPDSEIEEFISIVFSSETSEQRRKLSLFYNNGEDQYDSAFIIELRYDDLQERIKKLESEKKEEDEKLETERKRVNDKMYELLGWYPSIENFTKITMAHLETLMHMIYCVQTDTKGRKLKDLGIPADILGDVPNPEDSVGAFPRITKESIDKDGYSKKEDVWVGKYNNGVGFREVDMVNGLFNGVQELDAIERAIELAKANAENPSSNPGPDSVTVMTMPITPYDFVLKKNPYGDSDVINNQYAFAGKVAMRMMGVLALSGFRKDPTMGKENDQGIGADLLNYAAELGKIEAHNFNTLNKLANADIIQAIGEGGAMSNGKDLLKIVQGNVEEPGNLPWVGNNDNDKVLLTNNGNLWINRYASSDGSISVQPLQNMSFANLDKSLGMVNGHKYPVNDEDILIMMDYETLDEHNVAKIINTTGNTSVFNTATVTEQYDQISQMLENALASSTIEEYGKFAEVIKPLVVAQDPAGKELKNIIISDNIDIYSFHKRGDDNINKTTVNSSYVNYNWYSNAEGKQPFYSLKDDEKYEFKLNFKTDESNFINESFARNIESFTLTEVFGYKYENDYCIIDKNKSLFAMPDFYKPTTFKGRGTGFDKILDYKDVQVARFLFGIDGFDAFVPLRNIQRSFGYAPKVTILQIGAALAMYHTKMKIDVPFTLKNYVSVFKSKKGKVILPALPTTLGQRMEQDEYTVKSIPQKLALIKYFKKWSDENYSKIQKLSLYSNLNNIKQCKNSNYVNIFTDKPRDGANENNVGAYTVVRAVFNQDAEVVKTLSRDLLSTVCYVNLTVDGYDRVGVRKDLKFSNGMASRYRVSASQGEAYLDGFLTELRNICGIPQPATDPTQMAKEATQTTEAMKIELYRYLKQVYDKWVCATKEEDWGYNQFFSGVNNPGNPAGNNFYFIDSFYNKVGDKIMVNPMSISKRLKLTTSSMDTNVMMYSFLSEVYGDHRCMMKCVQNFNLLSDGIGDIFKPVPYSEMVWAASLPDFVVIYSYEPSRNLAVANAEYKDDGFMLNDEDDTPLPITSRSDASKYYKIPAFGVSYGRQYQSYFKSVNVDMSHPVLTEQALIAKHAILATSRGSTYKNVRAQDAYDIYSNQSYTCNVEMMGCAWVQPLMYFVLLNVPFFRGSYLVSKVKHHIVPGDMTTTITGVRMSKYCNNIVDNIFSDEKSGKSMGGGGDDERKYEVANLDNNCPYKIYPVVQSNGTFEGDESGPTFSSIEKFVVSMYHTWISNGTIPEIAKTTTAQAVLESYWGRSQLATEGFNYGGIKSYSGKPTIVNRLDGKKYAKFESLDDYVKSKIKAVLDANFPTWRNATTPEAYLKAIMADGMKTRYATVTYAEYSKSIFDIMKGRTFVDALKNVSSTPTNTKDTEEKVNKELPKLFFQAVEKSVASTPNANVKLESSVTGNTVTITQSGKNDKMAIVFDIILNSEEYYKYIYKLFWYYANTTSDPNPSSIVVTVSADIKKNNAERVVLITKTGNGEDVARREKFTNDTFNVESGSKEGNKSYPVAEGFLRSIVKKYDFNKSIFNKECPQFDGVTNIFDRFSPTPCISTMNTEIYGNRSEYTGGEVTPGSNFKIGKWNVGVSVAWINKYSTDRYPAKGETEICTPGGPRSNGGKYKCHGICAKFVCMAICCPGNGAFPEGDERIRPGDNPRKNPSGAATNLHYGGVLKRWKFKVISEGDCTPSSRSAPSNAKLQAGDVAIIGRPTSGKFHACMWTGEQWVSDFKQGQNMSPYRDRSYYPGGTLPFFIYRYDPNS